MSKSKILLAVLCASSLSAASFSLGGLIDAISEKASSVSTGSTVANEPDVLVKDLNITNTLSAKPYLRGVAQIDYSVIPAGYQNTELGGGTHGQGRLVFAAKYPDNKFGLRALSADANRPTFSRIKERNAKKFSNPMSKSPYAFDLSNLDEIMRSSMEEIYSFNIKTHMKIPDNLVKKGKIVFETNKGPVFFAYREQKPGIKVNPYALVCIEKVNGKVMADKKITTTVSKDNILEYGMTCYMAGYPQDPKGTFTRNADSIQSMNETQQSMPDSWSVSSVPDPLAKTQSERYKLTNRDFFLYHKEVYSE